MAKCTPTVDIREYPVLTYTNVRTQTGVTLELSNVEAHVAARVLGSVGGAYDHRNPNTLRSILSGVWDQLRAAGYCTEAHMADGLRFFHKDSRLDANDIVPADIAPKVAP